MAGFFKIVIAIAPAAAPIWAFVNGHIALTVCLAFTALTCALLFLDAKKPFTNRKTIAEADLVKILTGAARDGNNNIIPAVDVGAELTPKLHALASINAQARANATAANGTPNATQRAIERTQYWLGRMYHPTPLHPDAINKAILIAIGYSLLFFIAPFFLGGDAKLGETILFSKHMPIAGKLLIAVQFAIFGWIAFQFTMRADRFTKKRATASLLLLMSTLLIADLFKSAIFGDAGAGAVAVAVAVAGAVGRPIVVPAVDFFYFVYAVVVVTVAVVGSLYLRVYDRAVLRARVARGSILLIAFIAAFYLLAVASPHWLARVATVRPNAFYLQGESFVLLFFLGVLPFLNAVFDFISVAITQWCLHKMKAGNQSAFFWLIDVAAAIVLVAGLYATVYGALLLMQWFNWGVDAKAIFRAFVQEPMASGWLVLLAITNVVPTVLHFTMWVIGTWRDELSPFAKSAPALARKTQAGETLGAADAATLAKALLSESRWLTLSLLATLMAWATWGVFSVSHFILRSLLS